MNRLVILVLLILYLQVSGKCQTYFLSNDSVQAKIQVVENNSRDSVIGFKVTFFNKSSNLIGLGYDHKPNALILDKKRPTGEAYFFDTGFTFLLFGGGSTLGLSTRPKDNIVFMPIWPRDSISVFLGLAGANGLSLMVKTEDFQSSEKRIVIDYIPFFTSDRMSIIDFQNVKRSIGLVILPAVRTDL